MREISETCIFCEAVDLFDLPAVVADAPWPVCQLCAGAGAALLAEGAILPVRHCLHLVAMEIEQFAEGYAVPDDRAARKWLFRIKRNMARGAFREVCPCARCVGADGGYVVLTDLPIEGGPVASSDEVPLSILRTMSPGHKLESADGVTWNAVDLVAKRLVQNAAETRRGPVGSLAKRAIPPGPGEWVRVRNPETGHLEDVYQPVDQRRRELRDADAKRYWSAFRQWGPGYLSGDWYVTEPDGEAHPCPRVKP